MNDTDLPKPTRSWRQYSLRGLLLFTAIVAGLLSIFQLGFQLGIAWVFLLCFVGAQGIFVMGSAYLPRGQSPGWLATAMWILLMWAILAPWFCWTAEMSVWREMPRGPWLRMGYTCLYKLNGFFVMIAPFVFAAIGGFSRRSWRFFIVLIASQALLAAVVIAIGVWIVSLFAWPSGCY
ncbi:MAG: hypothetical protein JW809_16000 [Pirellulales bacterium]|nr:hypothetical protein [Pirellulales bacterium]